MNKARTKSRSSHRLAGFTMVELLAVIGIILVLAGLLLVAMGKARQSARRSQATRQMATITAALDSFKGDFGWYPPLVTNRDEQGNLNNPLANGEAMYLVPEAAYRSASTGGNSAPDAYRSAMEKARYHSSVSLALYLIGAGDLNGDEIENYDQPGTERIEPNFDDGLDGPGIRHPGADKSWGGAADRTLQQTTTSTYPNGDVRLVASVAPPRGREYGPYLDPGLLGDSLVRRADSMFHIVDSYGYPIRYYRNYPTRGLSDNQLDLTVVPIELRSLDSFVAQTDDDDIARATEIDRELLTADFALLSCNSDGVDIFETGELTTYEAWVGDQGDGFVPPYGDLVRSEGGTLVQMQGIWGERAETSFLDTELEEEGKILLEKYLKSNVRSLR